MTHRSSDVLGQPVYLPKKHTKANHDIESDYWRFCVRGGIKYYSALKPFLKIKSYKKFEYSNCILGIQRLGKHSLCPRELIVYGMGRKCTYAHTHTHTHTHRANIQHSLN